MPLSPHPENTDLAVAEDDETAPDEAQASEEEPTSSNLFGESEEEPEEESSSLGPGEELDDDELVRRAAVLLFTSPDPLSQGRLQKLLERPQGARVKQALQTLQERLTAAGLPWSLRQIAGGWRLVSDPELADVVARLRDVPKPEKITAASLETLAILAYRQPVTKAEVEAIRGVQSGPMLRSLVDRGLAKVTGRADQPGSPLQYGTTKEFLERFGLASLKDLPRDGELIDN